MKDKIRGCILGAIIGDVLGVPVEFYPREKIKLNPVTNMRSGGSHKQPKGTWSDDSSMILCTVDSLLNGLDYENIGDNFCKWAQDGYLTPHGKAFGIGRGTLFSLGAIHRGVKAVEAGQKQEKYNGNGSLMRIIPIAFYIDKNKIDDWYEIIKNLSSITHGHPISYNSCAIYTELILYLLRGMDKYDAYNKVKNDGYCSMYIEDNVIDKFNRILQADLQNFKEEDIKTTGYVIDSLEASIWCFMNSSSYKECVLKAVNLGGDTDAIASIAGGMAGIYYGFETIPEEWINEIVRKDDILILIDKFSKIYGRELKNG